MKKINDIETKYKKQVKEVQYIIENRENYNLRNLVLRALIKSGIALDYAFPYILSSFIIGYSLIKIGQSPFKLEQIVEPVTIETIDTSTGIHQKHTLNNPEDSQAGLKHTTGWKINTKGQFERIETTYIPNKNINLSDPTQILSMTKEQIENSLLINSKQTIIKERLTKEDDIYNEDALIIIKHSLSDTITNIRQETNTENLADILNFTYFTIILAYLINKLHLSFNRIFIKDLTIRDRLKLHHAELRHINKYELEFMEEVLKKRKENLILISTPYQSIGKSENYPYRLRKKKKHD